MKFTLTITDATASEITALLGGTAIGSVPGYTLATTTDDTDDELDLPPATIQPGEVDAAGFPWDERIHSGAKSKTAANNWRYRKGVGQDTITAVEAELRARSAAGNPTPPVAPVAPVTPPSLPPATTPVVGAPPPSITGLPAPSIVSPSEPAAVAPTPPPAPVAAPVAPPVVTPGAPPMREVGEGELDFGGLMGVISAALTGGKLPEARLAELCGLLQVTTIGEIAASPLKIAQAYNWLFGQKLILGT